MLLIACRGEAPGTTAMDGSAVDAVDHSVDQAVEAFDAALDTGPGASGDGMWSVPPTSAEEDALLGDDRVGDVLRGRFRAFTGDPLELAEAVGASLNCERANVHVALEAQTRRDGMSRLAPMAVPRAVLSGCTGDAHEVFVVMTSPEVPATPSDPLADNPTTELIALDRTTGLYNYYALTREQDGFTLQRWIEADDGSILERRKAATRPMEERIDDEGACFYCHANGAPILLDAEPFNTPWLGPEDAAPATYTGITGEMLRSRDSVDSLIDVVRRGVEAHVAGDGGVRGYGPRVIAGLLAGQARRLIQPVFCPTEYQLVSPPAGRAPSTFFVDPSFAGETPPHPVGGDGDAPLVKVPIRAQVDVALERFVIAQGFIDEESVLAARLWDPSADLSRARCDLYWELQRDLPQEASASRRYLREALHAAWQMRPASAARTLALRLIAPKEDATQALAEFRTLQLASLAGRASSTALPDLLAEARLRAGWMIERFVPPFALDPLVYEVWLH
ncbi:MAG: hypothetical protein AAF411_08175 [Myxococcota bacterium]